jgi:hypothetical protein
MHWSRNSFLSFREGNYENCWFHCSPERFQDGIIGHIFEEGKTTMASDILLSPCPACEGAALAKLNNAYQCNECGLTVKEKKRVLGFGSKGAQFVVQTIGDDFSMARGGIIGHVFSLAELKNFHESVYPDQTLADFAEGNYDALNMPASTLAQILLEQLRETCYIQINDMRRAHGPVLGEGGNRFPEGKTPTKSLTWQDEGNLFLTNIRLVFPSDSFTFIRMDRRLIGLKTYEDGLAVQRKGEDFATYLVGCGAHQASLVAAYIQGKVPTLKQAEVHHL